MEPAGDSIVLEEEIDPNYEPTEKEVHEYASWLGMDLETEQDLFWIAREGLKAPLPENWKPCKTTDTEEIYYFNFATGQSTWDHPCDEYYRKVYDDHKKKRSSSARSGGNADGDERKKKEKEDVAELLGKKSSKKKKGATTKSTTEALGPPVLARGAALGEKKPLPGLSSGKLKGLSSGNLGSVSSLRPVASLGRLKGEAKDDGDGSGIDDDGEEEDEAERKPSPRALSKPPLGILLTKKPLPSASSLSKADSKAELDEMIAGFDQKKQKLVEEHNKALQELEGEHEAKLSDKKKRAQQELQELQEQEDAKLKQRRREFDKKMNEIENQYDKDESNLLRERKENIKRLESEMMTVLSRKKQELERDQQKEIERMQSRLDAKLQELKEDYERQEKLLKQKSDGLSSASELANEVEKLKNELRQSEKQVAETSSELTSLRQAQIDAEEKYTAAVKQIEAVKRQLTEAQDELACQRSQVADPPTVKKEPLECSECSEKASRIVQVEEELDNERQHLKSARDSLVDLQRQLDSMKVALEAGKNVAVTAASGSSDAEVVALRQADAELRRDLRNLEAKYITSEQEISDWKTKCGSLEKQRDQLLASAKEREKQESASLKPVGGDGNHEDELETLRGEITDLNDQVQVLTKTNYQIKEQLLKESNEKKQLREQLNTALADDTSRELSHKVGQLQREVENLQKRLQEEIAAKDQQLQEQQEHARAAQQVAEQSKRQLEGDVSRYESENRKLAAEAALLKRQMEERIEEVSQAGDAKEEQAAAAIKWEAEQLQSSLKLVTRDKEELTIRIRQLETELDEATQTKHQVEVERDNEASRAKKKEAEREAIQQKLNSLQEELKEQVEKARAAVSESADLKTQLGKLKFKEQSTQGKCVQIEEEVKALETKLQAQQSDIDRLTRELRVKSVQLDDKSNSLRDLQGEMDVLNEQLSDAKRQLGEWRARNQSGSAAQLLANGVTQGSSEVAELRLRVSELEAKVESLAQEKTQLIEKQRTLTQKQLTAESSLRAMEVDRDRLMHECQSMAQDTAKWKDRLEKRTKEAEQLKAGLFSANAEKELAEMALSREKEDKRELTTQKTQLEKAKKQLEGSIESLTSQLEEIEASQARTVMESQALQSKLKHVDNELETMTRELRATQDERDALTTKSKQQASDMAALEARLRLLRTETNEHSARFKASEDDMSHLAETIKRLESQLDEKESRLRKECDERENINKQLAILRSEKEELETELLAMKRKNESVEARYKDHESAASRGDFQLKLRVQQLEAERDGIATGKDRVEQQAKGLEKELLRAKDELNTAKNELETSRNRIKALTLERDEFQTALLQAQSNPTISRGATYSTGGSSTDKSSGTMSDAMLVRLQLADVNKSELEQHLADVATQLELATRRCTLAEARCRDQGVELESLHVEIASLRSSLAKMHLSALETLPLVERLEYEHRKRTLKRDFSAQLRDFQEREEHAVMRQKARLRALHEKQIEELVDELDAKKQRRLECEEQFTTQMLTQLRSERDAQLKEMRKHLESELLEEERVLKDQKERRLESVAASVRQDEEDERARLREQRQIRREQELVGKDVDDGNINKNPMKAASEENNRAEVASPGQLRSHKDRTHPYTTERKTRSSSMSDDGGSESDNNDNYGRNLQRQSRRRTSSQRDDVRRSHRHDPEIERWRQRLAEETTLLDKAKMLVADQKKQLKKQAEKVKKDKLTWKHEWTEAQRNGGTSGHRMAILQEMKAMIDHSASSWNASVQQLREREEWIRNRELTLRKMRRALASLRDKRQRSRSRRRKRQDSRNVRFDSASSSSGTDDNQTSDAVLDKLARLDGKLASDTSEFSSDDRWAAATWPSYAFGLDRTDMYMPSTYRYPLSTAFADGLATSYRVSDLGDARIYRSPSLSTRTMSSRFSQRVWPTTAMRLTPHSKSTTNAMNGSEAAVQRRIARWASGREAIQHAATKQATWLSSLYDEVKAYGDSRAAQASDASPRPAELP